MTSASSEPSNVSHTSGTDKPRRDLPVIGARVTEDQRLVIDLACARLGKKRGHFMVEAAVAEARRVLERAA